MQVRAKRRYVFGLREVMRSIERKKAKCVIVTPNIERISSPEGGLFEAVESIVQMSQKHHITILFAMTRTSLGKAISKRIKIAALAILDPAGALILVPFPRQLMTQDSFLSYTIQGQKNGTKRSWSWPTKGGSHIAKCKRPKNLSMMVP